MLENAVNIHVVGASGAEGAAILALLGKNGVSGVTAHDFCLEGDFEKNFYGVHHNLRRDKARKYLETIKKPVGRFRFGDKYLEGITHADRIFVPQSWYRYEGAETLMTALKKGIPFKTMTELYLELHRGISIGVTGSNGKTSVSAMIFHILKNFGIFETYLVGNDRLNKQLLSEVEDFSKNSVLVMEISNRQLKFGLKRSPDIAVITNITPNHLDEHQSFDEYVATKRLIIGKNTKTAVLNYDNEVCREIGQKLGRNAIFFSRKKEIAAGIYLNGEEVYFNGKKILSLKKFSLPGGHNRENVLAAVGAIVALLRVMKIEPDFRSIEENLASFRGVPKRLELIFESGGVRFFNDIASTTPESTIEALRSFEGAITLIVGGDHKNTDYTALAKEIVAREVKLIVLPGTVKEKLMEIFKKFQKRGNSRYHAASDFLKKNIKECENLEKALDLAAEISEKGSVVLISPAGERFYTRFIKGKNFF